MNTVIACIDGSAISPTVCDAGAWASQRLQTPLTLLHVLDRSDSRAIGDLSGSIGLGAREHLLEQLTALDEQRAKLALEHGNHILTQAEARAVALGAVAVTRQQRHSGLVETLLDLEGETRLFVMGRLGESHDISAHTIGSHLESVVRSVHRPILVAVKEFQPPARFMVAFDGSQTAQAALGRICASPLLRGLPCHLVTVGPLPADKARQADEAVDQLGAAGFEVAQATLAGEVQPALLDYQREHGIELIVMGAYGHSAIRRFFVGSNTTRMLSKSDVPLLLLR